MNLGDIGIVFGISTSLLTGAGVGADYYLQHEYVPVSALLQRDLRELRQEIRELEYDRDHGGLTPREEWMLEQLRDDEEQLRQELE